MTELVEIDRKIGAIIGAIESGAWSPVLQERLTALEVLTNVRYSKRAVSEPEPINVVEIRPATADTDRSRIIDFTAALSNVEDRPAASEALRGR